MRTGPRGEGEVRQASYHQHLQPGAAQCQQPCADPVNGGQPVTLADGHENPALVARRDEEDEHAGDDEQSGSVDLPARGALTIG